VPDESVRRSLCAIASPASASAQAMSTPSAPSTTRCSSLPPHTVPSPCASALPPSLHASALVVVAASEGHRRTAREAERRWDGRGTEETEETPAGGSGAFFFSGLNQTPGSAGFFLRSQHGFSSSGRDYLLTAASSFSAPFN
jgi:hypothetical protein